MGANKTQLFKFSLVGFEVACSAAANIWPEYQLILWSTFAVGMVLLVVPIFISFASFSLYKWVYMWPTTVNDFSFFPFSRLIPLKEAAKLAYKETLHTSVDDYANYPFGDKAEPLEQYADWILNYCKDRIYGKRKLLDKVVKIPQDRLFGSTSDGGNNFVNFNDINTQEVTYTDLAVTRYDMKIAIKKIKLYGKKIK